MAGCSPSNPGMSIPCPTCPPGEPGEGVARLELVSPGVYNLIGTEGSLFGTITLPAAVPGTPGVGIDRIEQGPSGVVTVFGTNGVALGTFTPPPGPQGVGFTSAVIDSQGHLILTRTDGTTVDAGLIPKPAVTLTAIDEGLQLCVGSGCDKECQVVPWAAICAQLAAHGCVLAPAPDCTLPSIFSSGTLALTVGTAMSQAYTIMNATSASAVGLPPGLTSSSAQSGADTVVTISGTPTTSGSFSVSFTAANTGAACSPVSATLAGPDVTVSPAAVAPAVTSPPVIEATESVGGTIAVTTPAVFSGSPAPTVTCVWSLNGVPVPSETSCSQVTNAAEGTWTVTATAVNSAGSVSSTSNSCVVSATVVPCPTPTVTGTLSPTSLQVGVSYSGSITVANATSATVGGLPAGLTAGALSGTTIPVTGTPTTEGAYTIAVDAQNACGTGTSSSASGLNGGTGNVAPASAVPCPTPAVAGVLTPASMQVGVAYSGAVPVSNATSGVLYGLPAGLTAGAVSGGSIPVTGTPTTAGAYTITADLENACGTGTTTSVIGVAAGSGTVDPAAVLPCPTPAVVTGLTPTTVQVGVAYSGSVTVSNATGATLNGLPAGLTAGALSGTTIPVTGTPTTAGAYSVTADLTNACGTGSTTVANAQPAGSGAVAPAFSNSFDLSALNGVHNIECGCHVLTLTFTADGTATVPVIEVLEAPCVYGSTSTLCPNGLDAPDDIIPYFPALSPPAGTVLTNGQTFTCFFTIYGVEQDVLLGNSIHGGLVGGQPFAMQVVADCPDGDGGG
jgi:hypothetical protein